MESLVLLLRYIHFNSPIFDILFQRVARGNILAPLGNLDPQLLRRKLLEVTTTVDGGRTKHPFLPLFDGHSQSYQQWVKGTKIYHLKLNVYNKLSEGIDNIMQSLQGKTWCLVVISV